MKRGVLYDARRDDREVPYKIYHPADHDGAPLPLVVWSHGLGGSRDGAGFLARYVAAHGYIVAHLSHRGTDSTLWEGKPGHPWDVIRAAHISRRTSLNRFRDIPFLLDCFENGVDIDHDVLNMTDLDVIGMSGHSFGAITTQIMAGQKLGKGRRRYSLQDERITAAIAYSPSPTYNHSEPHDEIYGGISIPAMYMTGTDDESPISGKDYTYRLPIYRYASGDDQHLVVLNDADHMVFAGSRGKLGANPLREVHEEIIQVAALSFWDAYLKRDQAACEWLSCGGFESFLSGRGQYENRNMKAAC